MVKGKNGWKSFEKWLQQEVEETFNIVQQAQSTDLVDLLSDLPRFFEFYTGGSS